MAQRSPSHDGPGARHARVLVADDHDIVRRGLQMILECAGYEVCGEAATGRDAVQKAVELRPDIVVIDVSMPEMNGLEATRRIVKEVPTAEVLVLTIHHSDDVIRDVLAAGARGYMLKTDVASDLLSALAALLAHRPYLTSAVGDVVMSGFVAAAQGPAAARPLLTAREREIVQLIAEGLVTKEIAAKLDISLKTVETHRANVLRALGLRSVSDIVRYAIRTGIVEA